MNIKISEETIEIGGKEYKLFLNRTAIVNWERLTKATEVASKYQELLSKPESDNVELAEDTNPFEMYGNVEEELTEALDKMQDIYEKFYWVALYQNHKLSISEAKKLFEQAVEEYGIEQLINLANQMLENANQDKIGKSTKNLKALKSTTN